MDSSLEEGSRDPVSLETPSVLSFQYPSLSNTGDIRLLTLLPGKFEEKLSIILRPVNLELNSPPYQALSYAWGAEFTEAVFCDGKVIKTPLNLALALRYIRSETELQVLWADSICINQNDILERGIQVSLMGRIYQQASRMLVWLHEEDHGELDSVRWFLEALGDNRTPPLYSTHSRFERDLQTDAELRQQYETLNSLLKLPWFNRGWTTQEVCLSREAIMLIGKSRMDWDELPKLYGSLYKTSRGLAQRIFDRENLSAKSKVARSLAASKVSDPAARVLNLSYVLSLSSFEDTTNAKDKVYSALGIVDEYFLRTIVPNYSDDVSIEQVYIEATLAIIAHERRYIILSQVESPFRDHKLPSWVPDWRVKRMSRTLLTTKYQRGCTYGVKIPDIELTSSVPNGLPVLAHPLDEVTAIYDLEKHSADLTKSITKGWRGMALAITHFASSVWSENKKLYRDESSYLAIMRTLSADTLPFSKRIPKGMRYFYFPLHFDIILQGAEIDEAAPDNLATYYSTLLHQAETQYSPTGNQVKPELVSELEDSKISEAFEEVVAQMTHNSRDKRFFATANGRIGLACTNTKVGDKIYSFYGGPVPFLLRPKEEKGLFELVADCYLDGVMTGELYDVETGGKEKKLIPRGDGKFEKIVLV